MGFFEDKLAAFGRALDALSESALGSGGSGAFARRRADMAAWIADRADRLDDALARRGVQVSTLAIARVAAALALTGIAAWSIASAVRSVQTAPTPVVSVQEQELAASISRQIVAQKLAAREQRPAPPRGAGRGRSAARAPAWPWRGPDR